jgi:hypothetical protein
VSGTGCEESNGAVEVSLRERREKVRAKRFSSKIVVARGAGGDASWREARAISKPFFSTDCVELEG